MRLINCSPKRCHLLADCAPSHPDNVGILKSVLPGELVLLPPNMSVTQVLLTLTFKELSEADDG